MDTNVCWNVADKVANSVKFKTVFRKMVDGGDVTLTTKLPGGQPLTLKVSHLQKGSKVANSGAIFSGEDKTVGYEWFTLEHFSDAAAYHDTRLTIVFPFYTFEYDAQLSTEDSSTSSSANVKWGITGSELSGIGYLLTREQISEKTETRFILRRPVGDAYADHTLAIILQTFTGKAIMDIKIDHHDAAHRLAFKVQTALQNDIEKVASEVMLGYSVAGSPMKLVDLKLKVDKVNKAIVFLVKNSENTLKLEGKWKSRQNIYTAEVAAFLDNVKYLYVSCDFNGHIPATNVNIMIKDETTINFFVGFETEKDAAIKLTHTALGADVEDAKILISLVDGDKIATTVTWRAEAMANIQSFITMLTANMEATSSDQFWADVDAAQEILHTATKEIVDDLIHISNTDIKQIFVQLKSFTNSMREFRTRYEGGDIDLAFLTYCADSIDVFADFGIAYADEVQKVMKEATNLIKTYVEAFFVNVKTYLVVVRDACHTMKVTTIQHVKNIPAQLTKMGVWLKTTIFSLRDQVNHLATKYKKFVNLHTGETVQFVTQLVLQLRADIHTYFTDVTAYLKTWHVVQEIIQTYQAYQTWPEDVHFFTRLQRVVNALKTYFKRHTKQIMVFKQRCTKLFQTIKKFVVAKYKVISEYPMVAFFSSVVRTWTELLREVLAEHLKG